MVKLHMVLRTASRPLLLQQVLQEVGHRSAREDLASAAMGVTLGVRVNLYDLTFGTPRHSVTTNAAGSCALDGHPRPQDSNLRALLVRNSKLP